MNVKQESMDWLIKKDNETKHTFERVMNILLANCPSIGIESIEFEGDESQNLKVRVNEDYKVKVNVRGNSVLATLGCIVDLASKGTCQGLLGTIEEGNDD